MSKFYDSRLVYFIYFSSHNKPVFLSLGILLDKDFLKLLRNSAFFYCQEMCFGEGVHYLKWLEWRILTFLGHQLMIFVVEYTSSLNSIFSIMS